MNADGLETTKDSNHGPLIDWKTRASPDPGMVSWSSRRMVESNNGTNQLKHVVEIDLVRRNARGHQIVDVGVGTGRVAIALAQDGRQVIGVDSSQAMLDETRRLAGTLSLDLRLGDLLELPCAGDSVDTIVALNLLGRFPIWRDALTDWLRVVRPGGRILFDIHSLANVAAAFGLDSTRWPELLRRSSDPNDSSHFNIRVATEELLDFADAQQLKVQGIHPYGALLSADNTNWKLWHTLELKHKWQRTLGWLAKDPELFDLNVFLEQALVEHLAPSMAGRLFVVLEKTADPQANRVFAERIQRQEESVSTPDDRAFLGYLPFDPTFYQESFAALLKPLRCQHFLYLLVNAWDIQWPGLPWRQLLPDEVLARFDEWRKAEAIDHEVMHIARHWADGLQTPSGSLQDVASGAQYNLAERLLRQRYGAFTGVRT